MRRYLFVAVLACLGFGPGQCSSSEMLARYGYTELRPPSTLLRPGTLVAIQNRSPFEGRIICDAEASLGPKLVTMHSVTTNGTVKSLNNRSFKIDAKMLQQSDSESLRNVNSVTATIRNARIVELSDEAVLQGMRHRSPECAFAVKSRVDRGYTITMISSALVADFDYAVNFEKSGHHSTDMAQKAIAMNDLAAKLDGDYMSASSGELYATNLVLAVRDDEYLSALSISYVPTEHFAPGTRHLPDSVPAQITDGKVQKADMPVIPVEILPEASTHEFN